MRPLRDPIATIEHPLTPAQVHSLLWLGADGALPASVLSHRVGCGQPTITGVIDRLEKLGFAERERDTGDRRVVRVQLTAKGRTLYAQLDERITEKLGRFFKVMPPADRAHLLRIIKDVVETLRLGASSPSPASEEP